MASGEKAMYSLTLPIRTRKQSGTGRALEKSVLPALVQGGYGISEQTAIGERITGKLHRVDIIAFKLGVAFLISLKWQQVHGTAEEKVPYEVICLRDAVLQSRGMFRRAYLVLGGPSWTMREFYIGIDFERYLPHRDTVSLLTLEDFMARANAGRL